VIIGVRPEHVLADGAAPLAQVAVDFIEPLGAETLIHGTLADSPITLRLNGTATIRPGDQVPVSLSIEHCHFYDPTDERRIER
jgi:ABC-type sugar transport system ATPase subunit